MKCSICAADTRCYQLREITGHPGMMMQGEGMIFSICSDCLVKLVASIKSPQTAIETPTEVPVTHPRVAAIMDRIMQQHEMRKGGLALDPPKPKEAK